jgi:glycosyltransferase involved in cell wall biosynthesis
VIITSDTIGLVCKPADAASLEDAITRALGKSWDTRKILDYSEQFSWETVVKSIIPIYSQVMRTGKTK